MLIAGAGGHALELLDLLISSEMEDNLVFYDGINDATIFQNKYPILKNDSEVVQHFSKDPRFILGTGNPQVRYQFYKRFQKLGGTHFPIKGRGIVFSHITKSNEADIFNLCFIGAETSIGLGTLINTGAQVHHEVRIGKFSEINPGAVLLGKVEVGDFTSVGANATILPKIKIGNHVKVGAGSVVTRDVPDHVLIVGVPGRVVESF